MTTVHPARPVAEPNPTPTTEEVMMKNLPLTVPTSAFDRPLSRWVAAALLALAGTVATVLLSRSMPAGAPASSAAAAPMASAAPTAPVVTTDPVEAVYKSVEEHSPTF